MAARSDSLARFLLNNWHNSTEISVELYGAPVDAKKQRASRQSISRLREALASGKLPLDIPAGKELILDERWQRKPDGRGSEKTFRLRIQDSRPEPSSHATSNPSWLQLWFPPSSWTGWIVDGFETLHRDHSISHKHLYTATRGPDNWLTVASSATYKKAEACAGEAIYDEMNRGGTYDWISKEMIYLGLGTGSGMADIRVIRELLDQDQTRTLRAIPMDFSPVLLSETVANFYQEFKLEITSGRLIIQPILGDLEQPAEWIALLPEIGKEDSLVVGMFGNTIGHLQHRERSTIKRLFDNLDLWAEKNHHDKWTSRNSRMLLGISLQRPGGAPHGTSIESNRHWLNLVTDPLRTLLETIEGEYHTVALQPEDWEEDEDGRRRIAALKPRNTELKDAGSFMHERLPYKPSDGLTGVVQRYVFVFEQTLDLAAREVFQRHHLPDSRWRKQSDLRSSFTAGEDEVVLCEVTQFKLNSMRPALRRLGMEHGDQQVHTVKVGQTTPYAVLAFAPSPSQT